MDYTPFILAFLVILLILLSFLSLRRSFHARARARHEELRRLLAEELDVLLTPLYTQLELTARELHDTKVLVDANQPLRAIQHLLSDVAKVNDIGNLLSLFLNQQQEQRVLKTDIEKALANFALQQQYILKDVAKINDIGNLLSLMLSLEKRQRALGTEIEKSQTNSASQQQLLYSIAGVAQRIDRILSGAQSKGSLGEQIVGERLAQLPQEWVARNIRFPDGKTVEFGLRTSDGRLIPIDSKWTATELLDLLGQTLTERSGVYLSKRSGEK